MSNPARNFEIYELVPKSIFDQMGEKAWELLDQKAVDTIDFIREGLEKACTVNDYKWGGLNHFRGYRPQDCKVGAPKSAHKKGMAFDMIVSGMTAQAVRMWLIEHEDELPWPIRCEADVNWLHIDTMVRTKDKLYFFKP